jgi:hypothetical protein
MSKDEKQLMRRFVEPWRRAGPEMEAIRRRELARFDFAANWKAIDDLLAAGLQQARPRTESGMVEMQRWFLKLAQQYGLVPTTVREAATPYRADSGKAIPKKKSGASLRRRIAKTPGACRPQR